MHQQGYNPQLRQYEGKGGATLYVTGMEHSPTGAIGTGWERTPWHATQRAGWEALKRAEEGERRSARLSLMRTLTGELLGWLYYRVAGYI